MNAIINAAISRSRTVFAIIVVLVLAGTVAYISIPKESDPDVELSIVYVSLIHEGISPEDAERLLIRPMETQLRSIEGIREITADAREGGASVIIEFEPEVDSDAALNDVREKVDIARADLPEDTLEPIIAEISLSDQPSIVVALSGPVPERTTNNLAERLQEELETLPAVLEANIRGMREDLLEVVIDPLKLELYNLSQSELLTAVMENNRLIAAGTLDTGQGRFSIKVPGLVEEASDVLEIPIRATNDALVTLGDVTSVRRTFKDPTSYSRVNGNPAVTIEVVKRSGTNTIQLSEDVRAIVAEQATAWPAGMEVAFPTDQAIYVEMSVSNLRNSVITAVLLVGIVVVAALGGRSAMLVAFAIPASFLITFLFLWSTGESTNDMVLFGLVLAVGMLVDSAIVIVEYADRKMLEGLDRVEAYRRSAQRMAWPIISSTATTLAAFLPLLFWPGIIGQFMSNLPVTLLIVLTAALVTALIFLPVMGAAFGRPSEGNAKVLSALRASDHDDVRALSGATGIYTRLVSRLIEHPGRVILAVLAALVGVVVAYGQFGGGINIFPDSEAETIQVQVRARGNMSIDQRDQLVSQVEDIALSIDDAENVYTTTWADMPEGGMQAAPRDQIGQITLDLKDWTERRPAAQIEEELRERTRPLAGIIVELMSQEFNPEGGKAIEIQVSSRFPDRIAPVARKLRAYMTEDMTGLVDVGDTLPLPGIDWTLEIDRSEAGRVGADVASVGAAIQLVTNGIKVGEYRPDDATDEVDIRARFPEEDRNIAALDDLRVQTPQGLVPISNFVRRTPEQKVSTIERVDGVRVITVNANTADGVLANDKVQEIQAWLQTQNIDSSVQIEFRGEDEQRREATSFLAVAFLSSLFMMAIILVTQFNSFYHAFLILSAVVLSVIGVMLGLVITGRTASVIMTGIGVIALAGIVVNNNIVLIDTYQDLHRQGMDVRNAIIRAGAQRMRPIFLTTLTTVTGLLPMAFAMNIDFISRSLVIGAPYSLIWVDLALAVVFGLSFATILTLIITPCMLALPTIMKERLQHLRQRMSRHKTQPAE